MTGIDRREAIRLLGLGTAALAGASWLDASAGHVEGETKPAGKMLERPIPSTGEKLPVIGLGTSRVFDVGTTPRERAPIQEVLSAFVNLGGKVVDSSPMYGRAEEVIGDIVAKLYLQPDDLFVATKVWTTGKAEGIRQMEESERKLRAKPIDLIQVHNLVDLETQLATLADWKREKRIRYTGVTHYTASHLEELAKVLEKHTVDFVQVNYSVDERDAEKRLLPLAAERKVAVIANRPFAGGKLLARLQGKPLPPWTAEIDCRSWGQVLLKFVVSHPAVTCAIPATSKVEHLRDNMKAGYGRLPDEKMRARIAAEAV